MILLKEEMNLTAKQFDNNQGQMNAIKQHLASCSDNMLKSMYSSRVMDMPLSKEFEFQNKENCQPNCGSQNIPDSINKRHNFSTI